MNDRLLVQIAFGIAIFLLHKKESIDFGSMRYDANGLDYIISLWREHYIRQQPERTLRNRDRVASLGRGNAVMEKALG